MGTLVYSMQISLDGFIEDPDGDIGFSEPAEDVHAAAYVATPRWVFFDTLDDVPDGVTLVRRTDARDTRPTPVETP